MVTTKTSVYDSLTLQLVLPVASCTVTQTELAFFGTVTVELNLASYYIIQSRVRMARSERAVADSLTIHRESV